MCYGKQDFSFSTKKTALITLYYMRLNQEESIHFMIIISVFFEKKKRSNYLRPKNILFTKKMWKQTS